MDKYRKIKDSEPFYEGGGDIKKKNAVQKGVETGVKQKVSSELEHFVSIDELKKFKQYSDNLTLRDHIFTKLAVVSAVISYNSELLVSIISDSTEHFEVVAYRFKDNKEVFRI